MDDGDELGFEVEFCEVGGVVSADEVDETEYGEGNGPVAR